MHRRGSKEEDSGSDWDSMSEIGPPPPTQMKPKSRAAPLENVAVIAESAADLTKPTKENPPYDFKNEVKSPIHPSEQFTKPGKQRKGRTYDPAAGTQRHVTFAGDQEPPHGQRTEFRGSTTHPESDSEDPLYSTVKPKSQRSKGNNHLGTAIEIESQIVNKSKKASKNTPKFSPKTLEGIDNHGFVDDKMSPSEPPVVLSNAQREGQVNGPQVTLKTQLPRLTEHVSECAMVPQSHHHSYVMTNDMSLAKECPPPLIMTSGEALLESAGKRPVEAVNRALGEAFALITIPLTCFILFLHHFLRFFLQGLVRPIFVDSLRLMIEYLVQPFITGVMKPLLVTVHVASVSLSETLLVCIRPLTSVLQSIRLVEVHYTSRYSVEDI